ncbi:MAG: 50S ribosomal protein L25 [Deltaproteobacteria bacterium]|nr:50S ribosomal protein L25 [Deltaproteobacteria bacterium]
MEKISIELTSRGIGKEIAKKLRRTGFLPGIIYGRKQQPKAVSVNARDFEKATKTSPDLTGICELTVDGKDKMMAVIRDYQADAITRKMTHIDFQAIDLSEKLDLEVPINLIGIPVGVKENAGVLEQLRRKIHIRVLPTNIPSHIDVDVSNLLIGQSIHADEVKLPEGVEFPHAQNYTIAAVVAPAKEEVPVAAAPVEGEAAAAAPAEGAAAEAKPAEAKEKK